VLGFRISVKEKRSRKNYARPLTFLKKAPHAVQVEVTVNMELTARLGPVFEF